MVETSGMQIPSPNIGKILRHFVGIYGKQSVMTLKHKKMEDKVKNRMVLIFMEDQMEETNGLASNVKEKIIILKRLSLKKN